MKNNPKFGRCIIVVLKCNLKTVLAPLWNYYSFSSPFRACFMSITTWLQEQQSKSCIFLAASRFWHDTRSKIDISNKIEHWKRCALYEGWIIFFTVMQLIIWSYSIGLCFLYPHSLQCNMQELGSAKRNYSRVDSK